MFCSCNEIVYIKGEINKIDIPIDIYIKIYSLKGLLAIVLVNCQNHSY